MHNAIDRPGSTIRHRSQSVSHRHRAPYDRLFSQDQARLASKGDRTPLGQSPSFRLQQPTSFLTFVELYSFPSLIMKFTAAALTLAAAGSALAQRPMNESICDYYTTALCEYLLHCIASFTDESSSHQQHRIEPVHSVDCSRQHCRYRQLHLEHDRCSWYPRSWRVQRHPGQPCAVLLWCIGVDQPRWIARCFSRTSHLWTFSRVACSFRDAELP